MLVIEKIKKPIPYLIGFVVGFLFVLFLEWILPPVKISRALSREVPGKEDNQNFYASAERRDLYGRIFGHKPRLSFDAMLSESPVADAEVCMTTNYAEQRYYDQDGFPIKRVHYRSYDNIGLYEITSAYYYEIDYVNKKVILKTDENGDGIIDSETDKSRYYERDRAWERYNKRMKSTLKKP